MKSACTTDRPATRAHRVAAIRARHRRVAISAAASAVVCGQQRPNCTPTNSNCRPKTNNRFHHRNQQYSVIALTDGTGAIEERYAYSAYGEPVFVTASGTVLVDSAKDNRYTYTGREWDEELNLYHFRARMYEAESGRFCGRDPAQYIDGLLLYSLAGGRSLVAYDPSGLCSKTVNCNEEEFWEPNLCDSGCACEDVANGDRPHSPNFPISETINSLRQQLGIKCTIYSKIGDCVPGFPGVSLTCSRRNRGSDNGNLWDRAGGRVIYICISKDISACAARAIIEHELVHAKQFCEQRGDHDGGIPRGRCEEFERPAYEKSCRKEAELSCCEQRFGAEACDQRVKNCVDNGVNNISCGESRNVTPDPCSDDALRRRFPGIVR